MLVIYQSLFDIFKTGVEFYYMREGCTSSVLVFSLHYHTPNMSGGSELTETGISSRSQTKNQFNNLIAPRYKTAIQHRAHTIF